MQVLISTAAQHVRAGVKAYWLINSGQHARIAASYSNAA
jgi:hypothetical protein